MTETLNPAQMFMASNFDCAHANIPQIPYKADWENGTGYYDRALQREHVVQLAPGAMAGSVTPSGRKMIFVGTHFGPVLVFQRFAYSGEAFTVQAPNVIRSFNFFPCPGTADERTLFFIIGQWFKSTVDDGKVIRDGNNVGETMARIKDEFVQLELEKSKSTPT